MNWKRMLPFWAVIYVLAISLIGSNLPTPIYVLYQQRFGFSEIVLTLIYAAYVGGALAALLFLGKVSDQIGRRPVLLMAIALVLIGTLIFIFIRNVAMLFIARAVFGVGVGWISGTATAFLTEVHPKRDEQTSALAASTATMAGLALGALMTGLLAQYALWPTRLTYIVFLVLLVPAVVMIWMPGETVRQKQPISFRPRLGVPHDVAWQFVPAAVVLFCVFALLGLFGALAPSLLQKELYNKNHATAGAIVFAIYAMATLAELALQRMERWRTIFLGVAVILPALALVMLALVERSMLLLVIGTLLGGIAVGAGYRGSLEIINQIAPKDRRSEVVSAYYVAGYIGVALPVIGVGVISQLVNPFVANLTFSITVAVLAMIAMGIGIYAREKAPAP